MTYNVFGGYSGMLNPTVLYYCPESRWERLEGFVEKNVLKGYQRTPVDSLWYDLQFFNFVSMPRASKYAYLGLGAVFFC